MTMGAAFSSNGLHSFCTETEPVDGLLSGDGPSCLALCDLVFSAELTTRASCCMASAADNRWLDWSAVISEDAHESVEDARISKHAPVIHASVVENLDGL